jgi:ElaB/YqjD/DUF883 family membrane-anchored ribosome-binding protein
MAAETQEFYRANPHNGGSAADGEASRQARAAVGQDVHKLIADVENLIAETKGVLADRARRAQRQAKEALQASDRYVREKPWQTAGIAAATGLLIGFLVGRR